MLERTKRWHWREAFTSGKEWSKTSRSLSVHAKSANDIGCPSHLPVAAAQYGPRPTWKKTLSDLVDCYSGWPEIVELRHLDKKAVTITLEELLETFGIPENCLFGRWAAVQV